MPIFDWACPKCEAETAKLLSFNEYEDIDTIECEHCKEILTGDNRILGRGLKTNVIGDCKGGGYNSWRG